MKRLLVIFALTAAVAAPSAGAVPTDPPPPRGEGPPPAWLRTTVHERWLAYGGFCWETTCVTPIPPARRTDIPVIRAARGSTVVVHLAFRPTSIKVRHLGSGKVYPLAASKSSRWRVRQPGLISIEARSARGSASYLARIRG